MTTQKKVLGTYGAGSDHWVGDGFPVKNLFPSNGIEMSPFLMLDLCGTGPFEPATNQRGVGEHPHRGFETVTIAYQGSVGHRDSAGNAGVIRPGDVQWMTAASGVVHEELHEEEFTEEWRRLRVGAALAEICPRRRRCPSRATRRSRRRRYL